MQFILDLDDSTTETTRTMQGDPARLPHLVLVKGADVFLGLYGHQSALVSVGVARYQRKKLRVVGIERAFRSVHIVPTPEAKAQLYYNLSRSNGETPATTVVAGDRLDHDIAPGNRAGCITVRMRLPQGKYSRLEPHHPEEVPDYEVSDFFGLMALHFV